MESWLSNRNNIKSFKPVAAVISLLTEQEHLIIGQKRLTTNRAD